MFPFTKQNPVEPLAPQPAVTPSEGVLPEGGAVEFVATSAPVSAPSPFLGSEAPPAPAAGAPVKTVTTLEAVKILKKYLKDGQYDKVVAGTGEILAVDPLNTDALVLREKAQALREHPPKKGGAAGKTAAGILILLLLAAGAYVSYAYYMERGVEGTPPVEVAYDIVLNTEPNADAGTIAGTAPFEVAFSLRNEVPFGVDVTIDYGDNETGAMPSSHAYTKPGTFEAIVTAKAGETLLDTKKVTVRVAPAASYAVTAAPLTGTAPLTVVFTATTTGTKGSEYLWSFGDGSEGTGEKATHIYADAGTYEVSLAVDGTSADAMATIVVGAAEPQDGAVDAVITTIPTASAGALSGPAPLTIFFSGKQSVSENDGALSFGWDFGDGKASDKQSLIHTYTREGIYKVVLTVTDAAGKKGTEEIIVTATGVNTAPSVPSVPAADLQAVIDTDVPPTGPAPLALTFTGSGSSSARGPIASYEWDFGDGSTIATGASVMHVFDDVGRFPVKLTVRNEAGATSVTTLDVTVTPV